jgi:NDP-sugar pyrophosphorylase family protein
LNLRAFSGIHVISPELFDAMPEDKNAFSIIDVYLAAAAYQKIVGYPHEEDVWMDVGKIENLEEAKRVLEKIGI